MIGMSVVYDGTNLTEIFNEGGRLVPVDVTRNMASNFNNNYQDQGRRRMGQTFLYNTLSVKQITLSFTLVGSFDYFNRVAEKLGGYLNVEEPKPLTFGDEPNKVWEAIPSGQPTLAYEKSTAPITATVSVTFDVPKSYAEGKAKAFISTQSGNGFGKIEKIGQSHFRATLKNNGTAKTYPVIRVKHNSDNGWVGIVKSQTESYEIGNPDEADTQNVKMSECLLDYASSLNQHRISEGLQKGVKNVGIFNDFGQNLGGTLEVEEKWGRPHISLKGRGSGNNYLRGSSISWDVPTDSAGEKGALYEYFWWRQIFWLGSANQLGYIKLSVTDDQNRFLYGVEISKDTSGLFCTYRLLANNGKNGFKVISEWKFLGTHVPEANPFCATRGEVDIQRFDDVLQVYWNGTYPKFTIPEIKGRKSAKIHVGLFCVTDKPQVSNMFIDDFIYRKDFVNKLEDIPNRFRAGSILEVDMSKGKTLIDNLEVLNELSYLSEPFPIDTGKTELDIYFSSWIKTDPTIEIEWKERYV